MAVAGAVIGITGALLTALLLPQIRDRVVNVASLAALVHPAGMGSYNAVKAALLALFATASRAKRSRIRAFLEIYHALDGVLRFPAHLPERLAALERLSINLRWSWHAPTRDLFAGIDPQLWEATGQDPVAVLSSLQDRPLGEKTIAFGEVGLSGEIRPVPNGEERLREAATHGFRRAIVPKANAPKSGSVKGLEVIAVERLADAIDAL